MSLSIRLPTRLSKFCRSWYALILTGLLSYATLQVLALSQTFDDAGIVLHGRECASLQLPVDGSGYCSVRASLTATFHGQWKATLKLPGQHASMLIPADGPIIYYSGGSSRIPFALIVTPLCVAMLLLLLGLIETIDQDAPNGLHH